MAAAGDFKGKLKLSAVKNKSRSVKNKSRLLPFTAKQSGKQESGPSKPHIVVSSTMAT